MERQPDVGRGTESERLREGRARRPEDDRRHLPRNDILTIEADKLLIERIQGSETPVIARTAREFLMVQGKFY